uniref:J domain-containing protein n=1 Tax=Steinernema glaseri TaxID=37863 RepID=A0A1I8AU01_9BILA
MCSRKHHAIFHACIVNRDWVFFDFTARVIVVCGFCYIPLSNSDLIHSCETSRMGDTYYRILGVSQDASQEEIRVAYRRLLYQYHPDRNQGPGASEKFKESVDVYRVLSDAKKKEIYDRSGVDGLRLNKAEEDEKEEKERAEKYGEPTGPGSPGYFYYNFQPERKRKRSHNNSRLELDGGGANMFVGRGVENGMNLGQRPLKDPPVKHDLLVSLESISTGSLQLAVLRRQIIGADNSSRMQEKIFALKIKPGMRSGTKIIFPEAGSPRPGRVPADIVFVIKDKPHPKFTRQGFDIRYSLELLLKYALCGCVVHVPLLDGSTAPLQLDSVIRPNTSRR